MPIMKTLNGYEVCDDAARQRLTTAENKLSTAENDIEKIAAMINPLPVNSGGTGATTASIALNNLGIVWGLDEAPATSTPNSIYIQIN